MCEAYKGKVVAASVAEVMPLHRKLMLSITNGEQSLELRKLHVRPAPGCPLGDIGRTGVLRHLRAYARGRLLRSVAHMPRVKASVSCGGCMAQVREHAPLHAHPLQVGALVWGHVPPGALNNLSLFSVLDKLRTLTLFRVLHKVPE